MNEQVYNTPLSEDEAQILSEIGSRYARGEALAEIFGVQESFLNSCEAQAYELYLQGCLEEVKVLAEGIVALDSNRYYPYLLLGEIALNNRQVQPALELLKKAHYLFPDEQGTLVKLGEAFVRAGQYDEAAKVLNPLSLEHNAYGRRAKALIRAMAGQIEPGVQRRQVDTSATFH